MAAASDGAIAGALSFWSACAFQQLCSLSGRLIDLEIALTDPHMPDTDLRAGKVRDYVTGVRELAGSLPDLDADTSRRVAWALQARDLLRQIPARLADAHECDVHRAPRVGGHDWTFLIDAREPVAERHRADLLRRQRLSAFREAAQTAATNYLALYPR